ncbi:phenylalanine--tRNA ligase beta subunit-related protein [soil metagenome]
MSGNPLFRVSPAIFEQFPTYVVGCVAATGIAGVDQQHVEDLLGSAEVRARARYEGIDLKTEESFAAWRDAFSSAGWSPSRFPSSVEALNKRVQRGDNVPRINPAVDLANATALYYSVPVGTHDIDTFGDCSLNVRWAAEEDRFIDMNGDVESGIAGEIGYTVGSDIRTRRWVWRQGRNGLVQPEASNVFFPIDGFADRDLDSVEAAVNFLAETCRTALGAEVTQGLVSADAPEFLVDC